MVRAAGCHCKRRHDNSHNGEGTRARRGYEAMTGQHTQLNQEIHTNQAVDLDTVLRRYLADPTASWGLGTYGAVAEFHRTSDGPASIDTDATLQVVTARGALRITSTQELRAWAYEQPGHASESWSDVLTLCLPAASSAM